MMSQYYWFGDKITEWYDFKNSYNEILPQFAKFVISSAKQIATSINNKSEGFYAFSKQNLQPLVDKIIKVLDVICYDNFWMLILQKN